MSEEEWERDFISILLDSNLARKSSQVFLYFDFTLSRVAVSDECSWACGCGLGFLGMGILLPTGRNRINHQLV